MLSTMKNKKRVTTPSEVETWYILPAVRKQLVVEMIKLGLSQKKAADKIGITEAAVSQYISGKRGYDVKFDKKTVNEIKRSAKRIVDGAHIITELNGICEYSMKNQVLCKVHKKHGGAARGCDICFKR